MALFLYFAWCYVVFSRGVFSSFCPFTWLSGEKTKNKSLRWRDFAWRFFVFSRLFSSFCVAHLVISSFRLVLFRLFVILRGVFLLFRLFTWRSGGAKRRNYAMQMDEITIKTPREITKRRNSQAKIEGIKSVKWRYFAWRFLSFHALFCHFAWSISLFRHYD